MYKEEIVIYREGSLEQDKANGGQEDERSLLARPPLEDHCESLQKQTDRVQFLLLHLPLLAAHLEVSVDGCHCKVDNYWAEPGVPGYPPIMRMTDARKTLVYPTLVYIRPPT